MRIPVLASLLATLAGPAGAAIIEVSSTVDVVMNDARCSLREAILAADGDAGSSVFPNECAAGLGADVIEFAIPGDGPHVPTPNPRLPDVKSQVVIDGFESGDTLAWSAGG